MKNLLLIILLSSFFTTVVFATPLAPDENATIYAHLVEVNKLWQNMDVDESLHKELISFENDVDRIQHHLILIQQILSQKNVTHLTPTKLQNRQHHLSVLANYYSQKQFPINSYHDERKPYFVDKMGTACAVGYLLLQDGQDEFVKKIAADNNYVYVMEMNYPELNKWATENGFSKEELALIQPGYPPTPHDYSPVGNNLGVDGKINKLLTSFDGELMYMGGAFHTVDGNEAHHNITSWNGEEWLQLGNGVDGEILDMDIDSQGNLYVVGSFIDPTNISNNNIAMWDGTEWTFLQQGEMNGAVYAVVASGPNVIQVGGDFEMIGGNPISYIANFENSGTEWGNRNGNMTVNGPVYDIEMVSNNLLFCGDFSQTYPAGTDPNVAQLEVTNMAYWGNNNWIGGFNEEEIGVVKKVDYINGNIYIGSDINNGEQYYSVLEAGIWNHVDYYGLDSLSGAEQVYGWTSWEDKVLMYGDFDHTPGFGTYGSGLVDVSYAEGPAGYADFRGGGVSASAIFKDEVYFAGDFIELGGGWSGGPVSCVNLMKTTFSPITSVDAIDGVEKHVKLYYAPTAELLNIEYEQLEQNAILTIYDIGGKEILREVLDLNNNVQSIDLSYLPKGAYAVGVLGDGVLASEVIAVW